MRIYLAKVTFFTDYTPMTKFLKLSILALPFLMTACATRVLEVRENLAEKRVIRQMCYNPIIVPNQIAVHVAAPRAYGGVGEETKKTGQQKVMQAVNSFKKLIPQSFVRQIASYDINISPCSTKLDPGALHLMFIIHRGYAEQAPIGLYKSGVGVTVKILEWPNFVPLWQSEFSAGTFAVSINGPEIDEVDDFIHKLIVELQDRDWIKKKMN